MKTLRSFREKATGRIGRDNAYIQTYESFVDDFFLDSVRENNQRLYDYLALHNRIPKKRQGLLKKRQLTLDEMIEFVKSEANHTSSPSSLKRLGLLDTEQKVLEYLNGYLRITFAVEGWWSNRVTQLMIARKFDEINSVEGMFNSYDSRTH